MEIKDKETKHFWHSWHRLDIAYKRISKFKDRVETSQTEECFTRNVKRSSSNERKVFWICIKKSVTKRIKLNKTFFLSLTDLKDNFKQL